MFSLLKEQVERIKSSVNRDEATQQDLLGHSDITFVCSYCRLHVVHVNSLPKQYDQLAAAAMPKTPRMFILLPSDSAVRRHVIGLRRPKQILSFCL